MSRKSTKANTDSEQTATVIAIILIAITWVIIEMFGDYCNRHAEEHRQKEWERFQERNEEMMHMVNWDKAVYH